MSDEEMLARLYKVAGKVTRATLRDDGLQGIIWETEEGFHNGMLIGPIEYTVKVGDYFESWLRGASACVAYRINGKGLVKSSLWREGAL